MWSFLEYSCILGIYIERTMECSTDVWISLRNRVEVSRIECRGIFMCWMSDMWIDLNYSLYKIEA